MNDQEIALNSNKLVQYLKKPATEFTRDDIIKFIGNLKKKDKKKINEMYVKSLEVVN